MLRIPIAAAFALFVACASTRKPKETVEIELIEVKPIEVAGQLGMELGIKRKQTLAYLEIIERSPNAKSVTRITDNESDSRQIGPPVPSPIASEIVYQILQPDTADGSEGGYYSNIWRQKIGSFARTRVTFGKAWDIAPTYTRDGKRIVYASNSISDKLRLFSIRVGGGGGKTMVTRTQSADWLPSTSPDGKTVAYSSIPPNAKEPQIWTIDLTSGLPTQLREGVGPHVSPDGKTLLYIRFDREGKQKWQVWQVDVDGGRETQITQNTNHDCLDPRWSPDGKWIVYCSDEGKDTHKQNNFDLWLMTAGGGQKTQLTTNGSWDDFPRWSHDGKSIYFRSNRGGQWNIWRLTPNLP